MYKMLVIGLSAGGMPLVKQLLAALPKDYPLAIAIVAHLPQVKDKQPIVAGHVYVAPPDYHLLIEQNRQFALSEDEPVKSVRPSIDVLFSSAAEAFESELCAVILSGANSDGVEGMVAVKQLGGLCMVLNPDETEFNTMPNAVIQRVAVDYIASMEDIISLLISVDEKS